LRYAGIIKNDIVDSDCGICVAVYFQGCPHHCKGCHNPETWNENGGIEIDFEEFYKNIKKSINENGIERNLSILGGEPLAEYNIKYTNELIKRIKKDYPNIKIYIWTGYTLNEILKKEKIFFEKYVDAIIDGKYIESLRDTRLKLRGSTNQNIYRNIKGKLKLDQN